MEGDSSLKRLLLILLMIERGSVKRMRFFTEVDLLEVHEAEVVEIFEELVNQLDGTSRFLKRLLMLVDLRINSA